MRASSFCLHILTSVACAADHAPAPVSRGAAGEATRGPPSERPRDELGEARGELVAAVLRLPDLQAYLHPTTPGRVPLRVSVRGAPGDAVPALAMFGTAVVPVLPDRADGDVPCLEISVEAVDTTRATVTFAYRVEGLVGEVRFVRADATWRAATVSIHEQGNAR